MTFEAGQSFAHFKIIRKIGEGGMSNIWLSLNIKKNKQYAIKILKKNKISQRIEDIIRFQKILYVVFQVP